MKERINKLKQNKFAFFITIFVGIVLAFSFGSAVLTKTLQITGLTNIRENSWIIYFDDIRVRKDSVKADSEAQIVDFKKTRIEFTANLKKPGDLYEFTVYTVNDGTIDAAIDKIEKTILTEEQQKYLVFEVKYDTGDEIKLCDVLRAGTKKLIKATVKYKDGVDLSEYPQSDQNLKLFFDITYVQNTKCPIGDDNRHMLKILPNGGVYNKSLDETRIYLNEGETYDFLVPTKSNSLFNKWTILKPLDKGTYKIDNSHFIMGKEDVVVQAEYVDDGNSVARIMNTYFPTIQKAFDAAKKADWEDNTVFLLKNTEENVTNNTADAFVFDMKGFTVKGTLTNKGNLTIVNGKYINEISTGNTIVNENILTLGVNDGNVETEDSVAIISAGTSLLNKKTINFYDGYIEGDGVVINNIGEPFNTPKFYSVISDSTKHRYYLTLDPSRAVARLKGIYYYDLQEAIDAVALAEETEPNFKEQEYVIEIIRNFGSGRELNVKNNLDVIIDLNGFEVEITEKINNHGNLKIIDTGEEKKDLKISKTIINDGNFALNGINAISSENNNIISNSGIIELTKSTITSNKGYAVIINENGGLKLDNDSVINSINYYALYNSSDNLVLNSGKIIGVHNVGKVTIKDNVLITIDNKKFIKKEEVSSLIDRDIYAHAIFNTGTVNMIGGKVENEMNVTGTPIMIDGSIVNTNTVDAIRNQGIFNLSNGKIKAQYTAIRNENELNVNGGEIISTDGTAISGQDLKNGLFGLIGTRMGTTNITSGLITGVRGINTLNTNVSGGKVETSSISIDSPTTIIDNGTVISTEQTAIEAQNITVNNGLIKGVDGITSSLNVVINGGKIIGTTNNGVNVNADGVITGGTINGNLYGVKNSSKLTIGNKEDDLNIEEPIIMGGSYGLYIDGTEINFYDGVLKGQIDGYYGNLKNIYEGTTLIEETELVDEKLYYLDYLQYQDNWLKVGEEEYNSITSASAAIESEGVITVIKDYSGSFIQEFINNEEKNKKITFDLNGHNVSTKQSFINNVELTIVDSKSSDAYLKAQNEPAIKNNKVLTINGINVKSANNTEAALKNESDANINIINTKFDVTNAALLNIGNAVVIDTVINSTEIGIINQLVSNDNKLYGLLNISNSTISASNIGISGGRVIVDGGSIVGNNIGISSIKTIVEDGSITGSKYGIENTTSNDSIIDDVQITINGGTVKATGINGIGILTPRNIYVNGGTIEGNIGIQTKEFKKAGLGITGFPDVYITDGEVIGTNGPGLDFKASEGRYASPGHAYIRGGLVRGSTNGIQTIYDAKVTIGTDDSNVSKTSPIIVGEEYGYYAVNDIVYTEFFDGIIKGKIDAKNALINKIADGQLVKNDVEIINGETYNVNYLVNNGNWLKVRDMEFNSLAAALEEAHDGDTIKVIMDVNLSVGQEIPADRTIIFDLNGHSITSTYKITNKGNLTIKDSVGTGSITNIKDVNIVNESSATLTITGGTFNSLEEYSMYNGGTLNFNGGNIISFKGIYSSNKLTVNGGYIEATGENELAIEVNGEFIFNGGEANHKSSTSNTVFIGRNSTFTMNGGTINSENGVGLYVDDPTYGYPPNVEINDGTIKGKTYGSIINTAGNKVINGGHFIATEGSALANTSYVQSGIYSYSINGGIFEGAQYGIKISANSYLNNIPLFNIGQNDESISTNKPIIKGGIAGVYNTLGGRLYFYDGVIKGGTKAVNGSINAIAPSTILNYSSEIINGNEYEVVTLKNDTEIVKNIQLNKKYNSLQLAIDEAEENNTLKLLDDISIYEDIINDNDNSFTLDVDGHNILNVGSIINNKEMAIVNSNTNVSKFTIRDLYPIIVNNGNLSVDNIEILNDVNSDYVIKNNSDIVLSKLRIRSEYGINNNAGNMIVNNTNILTDELAINNNENITINGGKYEVLPGNYDLLHDAYSVKQVINSTGEGTLDINNSSIIGILNITNTGDSNISNTSLFGIFHNSGDVTFDALTIDNKDENYVHPITNDSIKIENPVSINNGTAIIKNSNINYSQMTKTNAFDDQWPLIENSGDLTFDNTKLNVNINDTRNYNNVFILSNLGTLNIVNNSIINDQKISNDKIVISNSGDLNIEDSTITSLAPNNSNSLIGISVDSGNTNISNSNISLNGSKENKGIYINNSDSKVTLLTGNLNVVGNKNAYGVYINDGTFVMGYLEGTGEKDTENVSITNPSIVVNGLTQGIGVKRLNGSFNFYDGIIRANTYSKPELVTAVEIGYEATTYLNDDNDGQYTLLEYAKDNYKDTAVCRIDDLYFLTLSRAMEKATQDDEIVFLKSITLEELEIPITKQYHFNLNKHTLNSVITNNGTLHVYNGTVTSNEAITIINNNTLIIGEDDEVVDSTSIKIIGDTYGFENSGIVKMYDGFIQGKSLYNGNINFKADGSRLVNIKSDQTYRAYLESLSEDAILNGDTHLILTINPNGGVYDNAKTNKDVYLLYGEQYELLPPTKAAASFLGWEVSDTSTYNDNTITMGIRDVTVKALWQISDNAVARIGEEYFLSIGDAIESIDGNENTTIDLIKNTTEDFTNNKNVILNLNNKTINGKIINLKKLEVKDGTIEAPDGITITNSGTLNVLNAVIENHTNVGILNTGILNVGTNDDVVEDNIIIKGFTVGIKQQGTLNYYDGSIIGLIGLEGDANDIPENYYLLNETLEDENQKTYLTDGTSEIIAKIVSKSGSTTYYTNLQDAIDDTKSYTSLTCDELDVNDTITYDYTGNEEVFTVPCSGTYKIETWGAQGGNSYETNTGEEALARGGYGGYSTGKIDLDVNDNLYINVGGQGAAGLYSIAKLEGGYNGGGLGKSASLYSQGAGGGATHIATSSGLLNTFENNKSSLLIVAAGGGGGMSERNSMNNYSFDGGNAGGYSGNAGLGTKSVPGGGQENYGGYSYISTADGLFGQGGGNIGYTTSGGGAGLYGGGAGYMGRSSGAGGSSYIGNNKLYSSVMYCYECEQSLKKASRTISTTNVSSTPTSKYAKTGNGYVKITYLGNEIYNEDQADKENITILKNFIADYGITVSKTSKTNIDLDGHDITINEDISNFGTLTISDSKENGSIVSSGIIDNKGVLNIGKLDITNNGIENNESATLNINNTSVNSGSQITLINYGTLSLTNNFSLTSSGSVFYNYNKNVTINGGTINAGSPNYAYVDMTLENINYNGNGINIVEQDNSITLNLKNIQADTMGSFVSTYSPATYPINIVIDNLVLNGNSSGIYNSNGEYCTTTIKNSTINSSYGGIQICKNGTITIENSDITYGSNVIQSYNGDTTINIIDSTLNSNGSSNYGLSISGTNNNINIDNSDISANMYGIYVGGGSTGSNNITLNGGSVKSISSSAIAIYQKANLTITDTEVSTESTNNSALYLSGSGIENRVTATFNGNTKLTSQGSTVISGYDMIVTMNDNTSVVATGTSTSSAVSINGTSEFIMNGGTIKGMIGLQCGDAVINNGTIDAEIYGIQPNGTSTNVISIKGGTVKGKLYGIYNTDLSKVYIGDNEAPLDNINPVITGGAYGVYLADSGYANFYNGVLKGTDGGYYGEFTSLRKRKQIVTDEVTENGIDIKKSYLVEGVIEDFLRVGDTLYDDIELAIEASKTIPDRTIYVIKDAIIQDDFEIPSNSSVNLDLNGYNLTIKGKVTNNNAFSIYNSSETESILTKLGNPIENNNYLQLRNLIINTNTTLVSVPGVGHTTQITNSNITSTYTGTLIDDVGVGNITMIDNNEIATPGYLIKNNGTSERKTNISMNNNIINAQSGIWVYETILVNSNTNMSNVPIYAYNNSQVVLSSNSEVKMVYGNHSGLYVSNSKIKEYASVSYGSVSVSDSEIGDGTTSNGLLVSGTSDDEIYIENSVINGSKTGLSISGDVSTLIISGTITGNDYGIKNSDNATIYIGHPEMDFTSETPYISGGEYGIYSPNVGFNYYNGTLRGRKNGYFTNGVINKRTGLDINRELISDNEIISYNVDKASLAAIAKNAKIGNGSAKITYIGETNATCANGTEYVFEYTGGGNTFNAPCAGNYKLEVWGAQGGWAKNTTIRGGYGGYAVGTVNLEENETLYVVVGGQGGSQADLNYRNYVNGGYNGGGKGKDTNYYIYAAGGGATHIATRSGLLSSLENNKASVLIVAGGGGGAYYYSASSNAFGADAGGLNGGSTESYLTGGTQTSGGVIGNYSSSDFSAGSFGKGGYFTGSNYSSNGGSGGGAGWYGGGPSTYSAGAGSSYIGNTRLISGKTYGYYASVDDVWVTNYLGQKLELFQVGTNTYDNFIEAMNAAISVNAEIKVLNNAVVSEDVIVPTTADSLTVNLNGKTLTLDKPIINNGNLTFIDVDNSNNLIDTSASTLVENNGNFTLNKVNVIIQGVDANNPGGIINNFNAGNLNIVESSITSDGKTIENKSLSSITIYNSRLTSGNSSVFVDNTNKPDGQKTDVTITGKSSLTSLSNAEALIFNYDNVALVETAVVSGVDANAEYSIVANNSILGLHQGASGGATINNGMHVTNSDVMLTAPSVVITSESPRWREALVTDNSSIKIYGGTITGIYGIGATNSSDIFMSSGSITSSGKAMELNKSNFTMQGGTITGEAGKTINIKNLSTALIANGTVNGDIDINNSTLNFGNANTSYLSSVPKLYGKVSNSINYNAGEIYSPEVINFKNVNPNFILKYDKQEDNLYRYYYSEPYNYVVNTNTNKEYMDLNEAIDEASNDDILNMIANISINDVIELSSDKKVTLNMKGYDIKVNDTIINNGDLSIINDTDKESILDIDSFHYTISSSGTLNIDNIQVKSINNTGKLDINNATILGGTYSIYSNSTETETITNSTIKIIYKYGSGNMNIDNCEVTKVTNQSTSSTMVIENSNINGSDAFIVNKGTLTSNNNIYNSRDCSNIAIISNTGILNSTGDSIYNNEYCKYSGQKGLILSNNTESISNINNMYVEIKDKFSAKAIVNSNTGTLNISNSQFKLDGNISPIGIETSSGNINLKNTDITISGATDGIGIKLIDGLVTYESGTIKVGSTETAYGLNMTTGIFNLGKYDAVIINEDDVSIDNPYIEAIGSIGYGISLGNGVFNYNDGKILGSTGFKLDTDIIASVQTGYKCVAYDQAETNYEYSQLKKID